MAIIREWQSILDHAGAVRAIPVDFQKAFDLINLNLLLQKLRNNNIPHCLIKLFFFVLRSKVTTCTNRN